MNEELQLRGHPPDRGGNVSLLTTVLSGDGRTLLAAGETAGSVRVWDPLTGELVAGPVTVDKGALRGLAVTRLGSGGSALVSCGARSVRLWHPSTLRETGSLPRRIRRRAAEALVVLPATASTPELMVIADRKAVRVTDPASGEAVFTFAQPNDGSRFRSLVGLQIDAGTPGFLAVRYGSMEMWVADRGTWQRRSLHRPGSSPDGVAFLTGERGEPWLAAADGKSVEVWDLRTGQRMVRGELEGEIRAMTPVPLGRRTVLAVGGKDHTAGVRLWDPSTGLTLGALFNGHGPVEYGTVFVDALAAVPGPVGTVRVASAANDGTVRVSPSFSGPDDTPPERLPDRELLWVQKRAAKALKRTRNLALVTVGMDATQVADLLGPPDDRVTLADALRSHKGWAISVPPGTTDVRASLRDREFWYYRDLPQEGMRTFIDFRHGTVEDVSRANRP